MAIFFLAAQRSMRRFSGGGGVCNGGMGREDARRRRGLGLERVLERLYIGGIGLDDLEEARDRVSCTGEYGGIPVSPIVFWTTLFGKRGVYRPCHDASSRECGSTFDMLHTTQSFPRLSRPCKTGEHQCHQSIDCTYSLMCVCEEALHETFNIIRYTLFIT